MKTKTSFRLLTLTATLATAVSVHSAHAGFLGAVVDVSANYPNATTVYTDGGNKTVTNAVEYPAGSFGNYSTTFTADVGDSTFTLSNTIGNFGGNPAFNGFVLTILNGPAITSVALDSASTLTPVSVKLVGNNRVEVNFTGENNNSQPFQTIIDLNPTGVPEPSTWALLGVGAVGLGFVTLRRHRRAVRA